MNYLTARGRKRVAREEDHAHIYIIQSVREKVIEKAQVEFILAHELDVEKKAVLSISTLASPKAVRPLCPQELPTSEGSLRHRPVKRRLTLIKQLIESNFQTKKLAFFLR